MRAAPLPDLRILRPALGGVRYPGGGDAIVVTWVGQVARVASFPIEAPNCATDPADERAAEQATTTLGTP
jgi:hypothetical protein